MNDNDKTEGLGGMPNPTPEDSKLDEELEQIKDMFQQELDKQQADSETQQAYGQEDEQQPQDTDSDEQAQLCECCGEKPRDITYGEDYPYCEDCRKLMLHRPISFLSVVVIILTIGLIAATGTLFLKSISSYSLALTADTALSQGNKYSALDGYISYAQGVSGDEIGKKVIKRAARTFSQLGYYTDADSYIQQYFTDSELKLPTYKSLADIAEDYKYFNATYNAISAIVSEPLAAKDVSTIDYKSLIAQLDALKSAKPTETETEDGQTADEETTASENDTAVDHYEPLFIEYYKYVVLATAKRPLQEQYDQLKIVEEMDPDMLWAYGTNLCSVCAKLGKTDEAEKLFNVLASFNTGDPTPYTSYANAFRFCDEPDAEKMLETVSKGIDIGPSTELYRLQAIGYVMQGDYESAYTAASTSFSSGYTFQNIYTFALCSMLAGKSDSYDTALSTLESYGYKMSQEILDYKNGKLTLEEILYNAEGDLA